MLLPTDAAHVHGWVRRESALRKRETVGREQDRVFLAQSSPKRRSLSRSTLRKKYSICIPVSMG